jgi:hypothetical protein
MKFFVTMMVAFFAFAGMVNAEKVNVYIDQPGNWKVDYATVCELKGSLKFNGVPYKVKRDQSGSVEIGGFLQGFRCTPKAKQTSFGGGGGGNADGNFRPDNSPTTASPPADGDNAGTSTAGGDGTGDTDAETPTPAGDGEDSTAGGYEKPEQGGDVDGFQADNSPTTDTPAPAGG